MICLESFIIVEQNYSLMSCWFLSFEKLNEQNVKLVIMQYFLLRKNKLLFQTLLIKMRKIRINQYVIIFYLSKYAYLIAKLTLGKSSAKETFLKVLSYFNV